MSSTIGRESRHDLRRSIDSVPTRQANTMTCIPDAAVDEPDAPQLIQACSAMRSCQLPLLLVVLCCPIVGCGHRSDRAQQTASVEQSLPVIGGAELMSFVRQSELPVLVEFGVDFNCARCQQVRADVVQLKTRIDQEVQVVRTDFNRNAQMVAELGGTICPTYVLFCDGKPCLTKSFPVSIELLESEVLNAVGASGAVGTSGDGG